MIKPNEAKEILKATGIKAKAVSKAVGMCESYVGEWMNNRRLLSQDHLVKIDKYFEKVKAFLM